MKNISSAPVTISVMVPAVDRAPLVSLDWLFFSASIAVSVALLIWSLLKCDSRPGVQRVPGVGDAQRDLVDQSGRALDELADDERQEAADHDDAGQR